VFRSAKYKWAWWFFSRPILPFVCQLLILMPLILSADVALAAGAYIFALPLLLPILGILNLPFLGGAFRAFRMDPATRRNHALEHATIFFLEAKSGRRFSGCAERNGFRIAGHTSSDQIKAAFRRVRNRVRAGEPLVYVSRRCGSNMATALGFGMGLLLLVAVSSALIRPPLFVRAGALMAVVVLFFGLRHGLGNAIQRRYFMTVDFAEVSLRNIRTVPPDGSERGPVHFVETGVVLRRSEPGR
jgi:Domain of unknown function (DUF6391)